ncbi:DUF6444 domain-containing protein [Micromonospora sp. NPDC003197]
MRTPRGERGAADCCCGLTSRLEQELGRIVELEARLKVASAESSKPPSSGGLAKPTPKSLWGESGRRSGRPGGQPGVTLRQVGNL